MCHQTVSLIARHLESKGLPTLCLGSARDILLAGRPPRAVFVDYPLGHSAGKPFDKSDQYTVVRQALENFESVSEAGRLIEIPVSWPDGEGWKGAAVDPARGDTRQVRDDSPRYQFEADRVLAEAAIAGRAG